MLKEVTATTKKGRELFFRKKRTARENHGYAYDKRGPRLTLVSPRMVNPALVLTGSKFELCTTVYKCLHGLAPQYLSELCVPVADVAGRRQLRSAS